jgi:ribosomal protein S20
VDKNTLNEAVKACKDETKECLQTVYDELNNGQQKKILKSEKVKEIFDRFGVEY